MTAIPAVPPTTALTWTPFQLIGQAIQAPLNIFLEQCRSPFVLLVPMEAVRDERTLGLTGNRGETNTDDKSFLTIQRSALAAVRHRLAWMPSREDFVPIPRGLLECSCHVVPIRKVSAESFFARISVGRTRNHDVVLRHPSVSKFHAWFDVDEEQRLFLADAGSRNQTFLNGQAVSARVPVPPGSVIRFGSVEAHAYQTEALWASMNP